MVDLNVLKTELDTESVRLLDHSLIGPIGK